MNMIERIGVLLINAADYIYNLTSAVLGGEEEPPKELEESN